jgi:hypothetical protein
MNSPGDQYRENSVAAVYSSFHDFTVVCCTGYNRDATSERIELCDTACTTNANYFATPVKGVLHHISPEFA